MRSKEAVFLLGFLCGCVLMNLVLGAKLDRLYQEKDALLASIADKDARLERLEDALETAGSMVVTEIQPRILMTGNRPLQIEIEKKVREWLDIFLGRELSSLDPAAVPFIVDGRPLTVNGRRVILEVETTIISDQLIVFIRPEIQDEMPEE